MQRLLGQSPPIDRRSVHHRHHKAHPHHGCPNLPTSTLVPDRVLDDLFYYTGDGVDVGSMQGIGDSPFVSGVHISYHFIAIAHKDVARRNVGDWRLRSYCELAVKNFKGEWDMWMDVLTRQLENLYIFL